MTNLPLIACAMTALSGTALSQPIQYQVHRLGLYGPEFSNLTGAHLTRATFHNAAGTVLGTSQRYAPTGEERGQALWVAENFVTTRLGFFDAAHTSANGTQSTIGIGLNVNGLVAGNSSRYEGATTFNSAWLYEPGSGTTLLGLTDALHTSQSGSRSANVRRLNASGHTVGSSRQFIPNSDWSGTTAWARLGSNTIALGLQDPEHTNPEGRRSSFASELSNSGAVAGISTRYGPAGSLGTSPWVYNGTTTHRIGFFDALHTSPSGSQSHNLRGISPTGMVIGETLSYVPFPQTGNSAWIASPAGITQRIGLIDSEHTNQLAGTQYTETIAINAQSRVIGRSFRYNAQGSNGESAWIYANGTTQKIGLTDAAHTGSSGYQFNRAEKINNSGHVLGNATRSNQNNSGGNSVWVFDQQTTRRIGLTDALHTSQNGFQTSEGIDINNIGDAIGRSNRYTGPLISNSGWFYNSLSNETIPLVFSTSANNEANTNPMIVLDNRTVLGTYLDYTSSSTKLFWWSQADGVFDITNFIPGGLQAANWQSLRTVFSSAVPGSFDGTTIVGIGTATGIGGNSVYILSPIPTPGALMLLPLVMITHRRGRK